MAIERLAFLLRLQNRPQSRRVHELEPGDIEQQLLGLLLALFGNSVFEEGGGG